MNLGPDRAARATQAAPGPALTARLARIAGETLPPELAHLAAGVFGEALAKAVDYAQTALAPATEKIYADDWAAFRAWCGEHHAPYLPAPPAIVAAYLAHRATSLGRSGLRLILAAVAFHHRRAGHLWSSADPVIATVMRGILRTQKRPVRPAAALTSTEIRSLLAVCGEDPGGPAGLPGLRDRALLLTCFAGGLRRSELVALDCEDVRFTADGLVLRIRQSKGDQEGEGADVGIARGTRPETCPVRAMEIWLRRAGIEYGAVFPRLTAAGTNEGRLTGNGVWKILRRRAAQAGLVVDAGERLSPHGMRAGFITEAYLNGALDEQVMAHARQKDVTTTRRYRKRAKTIAASPTKLLDL
jgi:integrase